MVEDKLTKSQQLLVALHREAERKNLDTFIFEKEELRKYFKVDETKDFAVALLAKNRDNALHNLKNMRRLYFLDDWNKLKNDVTDEIGNSEQEN